MGKDHAVLADSLYKIDYVNARLYFQSKFYAYAAAYELQYRVFPVNFNAPYPLKPLFNGVSIFNTRDTSPQKVVYREDNVNTENNTLLANGNISRGISVGNSQNLVVNSSLDLQLTGKISDKIYMEAYLSDKNVPLQPDGYSQQIADFDKIYVRIYDSTTYLQMGDIEVKPDNSYFLQFNRSIMGGDLTTSYSGSDKFKNQTHLSGAVAKGKYNRYSFNGLESVQGPYELIGANSETYITVIAGSEKVYLDGELLQRGENEDYTIDYNTAAITFTVNQVISTESRIIAEYQYTDRNYNRFIVYAGNQLSFKKGNFTLAYFNESDAKNQPVSSDLTDEQKLILANAGDDESKAIAPDFDTITFDINLILYKMVDTTINSVFYDSIFVQSYNSDSAFYDVGFTLMGENEGNYELTTSSANGKVYQWVAPVDGVPQGSYEPVQVLVAPEKYQMLVANGQYRFSKNTVASAEVAISNNDKNTFSVLDNDDNTGFALKTDLSHSIEFSSGDLALELSYEMVNCNFNEADRYRSAEFNRDWNLPVTTDYNEHLLETSLAWQKKKKPLAEYSFQYLNRQQEYSGFRNNLETDLSMKGVGLKAEVSLLNSTEEDQFTRFYRHEINLHRSFGLINLDLTHDFEDNAYYARGTDSLLSTSSKYSEWESAVSLPDSMKRTMSLSYVYRTDYLTDYHIFREFTRAHNISYKAQLAKSQLSQLDGVITWRKLDVLNNDLGETADNETNFQGRIEHRLKLGKGGLTFSTYYETGTGMETYKSFSYVEVTAGQGIYIWEDYNEDGIPQLDEFEVSPFPEEANYVRVYTPTSDYVKVYSIKLNETVNLNFQRLGWGQTGFRGFLTRFNNSVVFRTYQKHTKNELESRLNPFYGELSDTNLISSTQSFRNVFSFNKTNPIFGVDWTFQQSSLKSLLSTGFDQSDNKEQEVVIRWNITPKWLVMNTSAYGNAIYQSEYYTSKNSKIESLDNLFSLQWQPGTKFRIKASYQIIQKDNLWGDEEALSQLYGPEIKYNWPGKGSITFNFQAIDVDFSGTTGTSISYDMMDGYQDGENYKWTVNFTRTLNQYLQLSIYYNGRKPSGYDVIHTGQMTLSALF